ncbi:hypothetical protein SEPCBS57363_003852 [Sporothrix epigloea]|uniref:Uncharacterized protein n=1 Tax=Sporothrix epigloea TaxID=1892477 RepID=A0ABP0DSI4_9PEZI
MTVSIDTQAASSSDAGVPRMLTPPPQSASTEVASHVGKISLDSPVLRPGSRRGSRHILPLPQSKTTHAVSTTQNQDSKPGLPQSPVSHKGTSQPQSPDKNGTEQQQRQTLAPLVTVSSPTLHSPLPSPRTYSHVVRVRAVPLGHMPRRDSVSSIRSILSTHAISKSDKSGDHDGDAKEAALIGSKRGGGLTPPPEGRLQVSAYIIPRPDDKTRKTIHLERDFDLQTLLEAVPRPPPQAYADRNYRSSVSILASPVVGISLFSLSSPRTPLSARPGPLTDRRNSLPGPASPSPATTAGSNTTSGVKRPAKEISPNTPASPHPNLRRQAAKHSRQPSEASPRELPSPDQILADGSVLIPLCPHPSLGGLPALAAIILSSRVEAGDLVELPLPHPADWSRTIAYVYHSRGDLTCNVRQNMEYLGGKCE